MMKNIPSEIYLQINAELDEFESFSDLEEITWCEDRISDTDIEYVRGPRGKGNTIVCLCGSSRWPEYHFQAIMEETLKGRIVIPLGLYGLADSPEGAKKATFNLDKTFPGKQLLEELQFRKIDLSDEILVIRVNGYIGDSTQNEISYAKKAGKHIRYYDLVEKD